MAYELKRPVEISVRWVEERWAPRCVVPACWRAHIVTGGPRKFNGVVSEAPTRDAAIKAMIERLQAAGYSGRAGFRVDVKTYSFEYIPVAYRAPRGEPTNENRSV